MSILNPEAIFERLANDLPADLHEHVFVVGSLAAAYHYRVELGRQGVNTKDADLVVYPASDTVSCATMSERLLELNWRPHPDCYPSESAEPTDALRAIRLYPPDSTEYFVEFLKVPEIGQVEVKRWVPVMVKGGWYGLPTFKFLGLCARGRLTSEQGLAYAAPATMALANLLSHPEVRAERMSAPIGGREILRSAKDLGRVLSFAHLSARADVEAWLQPWLDALKACFPEDWRQLAGVVGSGVRELLAQDAILGEALHTCEVGLLRGRGVTLDNLRATGSRVLADIIEPLEEAAGAEPCTC